jgi:hypothetical protein
VGRVAGKVRVLAEVELYGRRASVLKAGYGVMSASPSTSKGALTKPTRGAIPVSSTNDKAPVTQEPDAAKVARPVL